jgi:hypothetical protein
MTDAEIEARAYQNTLDEAGQRRLVTDVCGLNHLPPPGKDAPRQLTDVAFVRWQMGQGAGKTGAQPPAQLIDTWSAHIQAQARIGQLERELADMTAEMAYANLRMTVAIQTSNQLIEAEVARRKAEALAFVDPMTTATVPKPFPARALAPQRGDGWVMVR